MQNHMRGTKALITLAVLGLAAAACEDDSGGQASDGTDTGLTTTTAAAPTGPPIRIFTTSNEEGGPAQFPERFAGVEAAVVGINEEGGIDGRPLEAITCDHEFDVNQMQACIQEAADSGAVVVLSHFHLLGDQATPILDEAGLAEYGEVFTFKTTPRPLHFNAPWETSPNASPLALVELGAESVSLVVSTGVNDAALELLLASFDDVEGIENRGAVRVGFDVADFAPIAQTLKEQDADAVDLSALGEQQAVPLVQAMDAIDYRPILIVNYGVWTQESIDLLSDSIEGRLFAVTSAVPPFATDNEEIARFQEEMDAAQRAGIDNTGAPRNAFHLQAWLAVQAFAQLAETIDGEITRESVARALRDAEDIDMLGLTPDWTPARDDAPDLPNIEGPQVFNDFYIVAIKDGEEVLYEPEQFCGDPAGC